MSRTLEALNRRVKFSGYIETQTPLHVGTGRGLGVTGSDLPVMMDIAGSPVVPGSSFKGTLRAQIEALIRGLRSGGNTALSCCDVVAEDYCVVKPDWDKPSDFIMSRACDVCLLFGGPFIGSRLFFSDMTAKPETWDPLMIQVRDGVAIDRESRTASNSKKYDFEIVPPGVQFGMEVVFDNPEDYEIGLLLRGFELYNEGFAFIGGKSSRGTGRIRIEVEKITSLDPKKFLCGAREDYCKVFTTQQWQGYYAALKERVEGLKGGAHV